MSLSLSLNKPRIWDLIVDHDEPVLGSNKEPCIQIKYLTIHIRVTMVPTTNYNSKTMSS